ncbi:MAG TPA: hypothetical protein VKR21_03920 [Solirubrobacteraceae bacterium]|nr:hypothetical protein [Solirubrobacteraceae bacterium]
MHDRTRTRKLRVGPGLLVAVGVSLLLAACGSGDNRATNLLRQTFTGAHKVNSGKLGFSLTITPSGTSALKGPLAISLSGPFQSLGSGRLPKSDFTLGLSTSGGNVSIALLSTGTKGYVSFQGQSYQMPQATFQQLESSFAQLGSSSASGGGTGVLGKLGIQPERWLVNPQVVGNEFFGGASTTHIHAGINVVALLGDLNTFLKRASSVGASTSGNLPGGIPRAERNQIASEIHDPSLDVWTGASDKTLRRLDLKLRLDTSGQGAALLGPTASLLLSIQYSQLNQPQRISPPATVAPFSEFQAKLKVLVADLQSGLTGGLGSSTGSTGSGGATGSSPNYQKYSQCIQKAAGDVGKMQKCASLLGAG